MATAERRFASEDENFFRVEYLEERPAIEDDEDVVLRHVGDTGAVVEVSGQMATKTHASAGSYEREYAALLFITRHGIGGAPRLLADNRSAKRLTVERIFGFSVEGTSALYAPALWHQAGAWLRSLHALSARSDDATSFGQAMSLRIDAALTTIAPALEEAQLRVIDEVKAALSRSRYAASERVFCHRDFRPRNWMVRRDGTFVAVDFEHARVDFLESDFARLIPYFREREDLREVFVRSYKDARRVYSDERMRVAVVVDALQTLAWGMKHGHESYEQQGRSLVASALDEYTRSVSWFYTR